MQYCCSSSCSRETPSVNVTSGWYLVGLMTSWLTSLPFPSNSSGFQGQQLVQFVQEVPSGCKVPEHAFHLRQTCGRSCVFYHVDRLCEILVAVTWLRWRGKAGSLADVCVCAGHCSLGMCIRIHAGPSPLYKCPENVRRHLSATPLSES